MKIAIVTGASSGMGKEFVRQIERFYKELDEIWVIARSEKKLEEIKKSHKTYIRIFAGDMEEDLVYKQVKTGWRIRILISVCWSMQQDSERPGQ